MADNTQINLGSGGDLIATDDIGGVKYPRGKFTLGADGVNDGDVSRTNPMPVNDMAQTSGGLLTSSFISSGAVQATAIKASAGQIYSLSFFNISANPVYVRLYNMATTPGAGDSANIIWRGMVPGNTSGLVKSWDKGLVCSAGIGMRCTGSIADNDTTVLTANTILGNVGYK